MTWTIEEKKVLESFHPLLVTVRLFVTACMFVMCIFILVLYCIDTECGTLFRWYSDWAAVLGVFVFAWCALADVMQLLLFAWAKPLSLSQKYTEWLNFIFYVRDTMLVVIIQQLVMTSVAFWISWAANPYALPLNSLLVHSVLLPGAMAIFMFTSLYMSLWSLYISVGYTMVYYFFVVWLRWQTGFWQYIGLDPALTPLWWLIVALMPVAQIIGFLILSFMNDWKHCLFLACKREFQPKLIHLKLNFATRTIDYWKFEIALAASILGFMGGYAFWIIGGSSIHFFTTDSLWPSLIFAFEVLFLLWETVSFLNHIVFLYRETGKNISSADAYVETHHRIYSLGQSNIISFIGLAIRVVVSIVGLCVHWYLDSVWLFFAMGGITVIQLPARMLIFFNFLPKLDRARKMNLSPTGESVEDTQISWTWYFD